MKSQREKSFPEASSAKIFQIISLAWSLNFRTHCYRNIRQIIPQEFHRRSIWDVMSIGSFREIKKRRQECCSLLTCQWTNIRIILLISPNIKCRTFIPEKSETSERTDERAKRTHKQDNSLKNSCFDLCSSSLSEISLIKRKKNVGVT